MSLKRATLSNQIQLDDLGPPRQFLIFKPGLNETSKGDFVFDDVAAAAVMADYADQGNELMLDYVHASIGATHASVPSEAGKAAGWFNLDLRPGPELWAVNVRWTAPAAAAIAALEWRHTSPTFLHEDGAIRSLLNVALTNLPATKAQTPLIAASMGDCMDPSLVQKALDAIEAGDTKGALEILKSMIAAAAGAPPEEVPADPMAEPAALGDPANPDPVAPPPEKPEAAMAAASRLMALSQCTSLGAAVAQVERWRNDSVTLEIERAQLAAQRMVLEGTERDALGVEMVTLCGKSPAEVWADPLLATNPKARKLRKAWASLSIEDLRSEVAVMPRGSARRDPGAPPAPPAGSTYQLTELQLKIARDNNLDPAEYAAFIARRDAARTA